jgi:hypothetical protein
LGSLYHARTVSEPDGERDFLDATRLTFGDATVSGRLDRPVELVIREVEGLPRAR